ncbi:MAG TPA: helix-turn-helix domain-containing protein [Ktedonobacterales bacterium]|nr:helix-turn-helix domain-containing protein [Ktedonobacterales bacterium]
MNITSEGRSSDSPYVEAIWRGRADGEYAPICPADGRWNMVLLRQQSGIAQIYIEGPITRAKPKLHGEGTEWIAIKFKLGAFLPHLPIIDLVNGAEILSEATTTSFRLHGSRWQFPGFDDVEMLVDRLVRDDALFYDPVVDAALHGQPQELSSRTLRRRFLLATGLTRKVHEQIERAQQAAALLEQGVPIGNAAFQVGYADQSHMARSLKLYYGQTPAQIARMSESE